MPRHGVAIAPAAGISDLALYGYFRSSAAYRVRIALGLKGLACDSIPVHLTRGGGEHLGADYARLNPQKLVPTLRDGDLLIPQSLAILEYLEERHPFPALLPSDPAGRARVRALAAAVACDIHPLNNLRVLKYLEAQFAVTAEQKQAWIAHWISEGFQALETQLANDDATGHFCYGDTPTIADCCLIPQIFNARRFKIDLTPYPTLVSIDAYLGKTEAFAQAAPQVQGDAE